MSDTGRVARARILRSPALPDLEAGILERRLIGALRSFRFEPAELDGRAVPVYYDLTLELVAHQ